MAHQAEPYNHDLGPFHRKVSTTNPGAQKWFDRGLIWSYGFHHEESARCEIANDEPGCKSNLLQVLNAL